MALAQQNHATARPNAQRMLPPYADKSDLAACAHAADVALDVFVTSTLQLEYTRGTDAAADSKRKPKQGS